MNPDDLQTFQSDLRAAVNAGVKLEIDDKPTPGSALSIRKLEQLEKQTASGETLPTRYQAAIDTWLQTGTMIPILDGLSSRINAWRRIEKMFRKSLVYILIIAALGVIGLFYFQTRVLPQIETVRQDLATLARPRVHIEPSNIGLISTIVMVLFVVALLVFAWWLFVGGAARFGWWTGGHHYMRCRALASATQTMQMLVAEGTDPSQAATLGGTLAGLDPGGQGEMIFAIKDLDRNAILSPAWVDYLLMIADRQYLRSRTWGPASMIVVIGGVMTFLYVTIAYWPIVCLIYDMSSHGGTG